MRSKRNRTETSDNGRGLSGMRKTIAIALASALGAMAAPAAAEVINLGTSGPLRHAVELQAGTWRITPLGADSALGTVYDGYSVWSSESGCDAQGLNCTQGWRWAYRLVDGEDNLISAFQSGTDLGIGNTLTAELALDAARAAGPFTFTLGEAQTLYFTFTDSNYSDNRGGVSFDLSLAPTAVPVPATALLMGLGLLALNRRLRARA